MSLDALDISAPTLHTQCHRHPMCSPNPALSLVWKRVENRPGVYFIRFSLPSPRHLWDLSLTCLVSFSGTWSAFQRENNPVFPWEEACPRNRVFWAASRSTLTLCAEKYTILNLLKWWPCHTSPVFEGRFCSLSSGFWDWDQRTAYGRLPWLIYRSPTVRLEVGIYRVIMEGDICMYSLPLGDRWLQGTGTSPRALAHLALHPLARSWARPHCPCLLCRSCGGVHRAPRMRDPHWQSVCTVPLPLAFLAGSSPSCMTVSVPPLYICTRSVSFPFLSLLKDDFITNTDTKPTPWLVWNSPAAQQAKSDGWLTREGIGLYILICFRFLASWPFPSLLKNCLLWFFRLIVVTSLKTDTV